MEFQIRDRLSFVRFLGLSLKERIPDAKTIWHYHELLANAVYDGKFLLYGFAITYYVLPVVFLRTMLPNSG